MHQMRKKLSLQYTLKLSANQSNPAHKTFFNSNFKASFDRKPNQIPSLGFRTSSGLPSRTSYHPALWFSSSVIFLQLTRVQDLTGFQLVFYHTLIKTSFIHSFIHLILRKLASKRKLFLYQLFAVLPMASSSPYYKFQSSLFRQRQHSS